MQCAIFGFSFIAIKKILDLDCPPFLFMSIRFLIGAVSLYAFRAIISTGKREILNIPKFYKKEIIYGIVAGGVLFLAFTLQTYGAKYTNPARNGLFTGLFVVFVPIIEMFLKKNFPIKSILLSLLCFCGVVVVSNISFVDLSLNFGDMLAIFCGFVFAIHFILLEKFAPDLDIDLVNFTAIQLFAVALFSGIISLLYDNDVYCQVQWSQIFLWLIFMGTMSTSLTYYIQTIVQSKITANTVSAISCMESVFAISFSLLLGYEIFTWRLLTGALIIISSMVCISLKKQGVLLR